MNKKLTEKEKEKELKKQAEAKIGEFFTLYTGEIKNFKLHAIEYYQQRVFVKFSSTKKKDDFIEYGTRFRKIEGGTNEQ